MKKKVVISSVAAVALVAGGVFILGGSRNSVDDLPKVKVLKGTIVDKALAVGTIEPENPNS